MNEPTNDFDLKSYSWAYVLWRAIENRNDANAAAIARYDPSKLLELVSPTRGLPLTLAAEHGLYETVQVALEFGIHPDDPAFFPVPLLGLSKWCSEPKYVALALKHGASPDTRMTEKVLTLDRSPIARFLAYQLYKNSYKNSYGVSEESAIQKAESLAMILAAGATTADTDDEGSRPVGPLVPSAAWFIASTTSRRPDLDKHLAALIPLLKACGADIDTPCGAHSYNLNAPIIVAVQKRNRVLVEAFIAAGARTDDDHLVHRTGSGKTMTRSLFGEVGSAFGGNDKSWVQEAVMRKVIADAQIGVATPDVSPESPGLGVTGLRGYREGTGFHLTIMAVFGILITR